MTSVTNVGNVVVKNVPQPTIEPTKNNLYRINFKANGQDEYIRQSSPKGPIYTQPPMLEQQQVQRMIKAHEKQEKKAKKDNFWGKVALFAGIAASIAIVASLFGNKFNTKKATEIITKDVSTEKTFEELCIPKELKNAVDDLKIKIERQEALSKKGFKGGGGIILYGEPGGGKNAFTYALTKYYQKLFPGSELVMVDVNKFKGMYNGQTENNIIQFVENIQKKANSNPGKKFVVFLDEFDSIARKATGANADSAASFQNAFKTTLNGLFEIPNVQVIAATNKAAKGQPLETLLDEAIVNRFSEKIHVPLPTKEQLKKTFVEHFKSLPKEVVNPELIDVNNKTLDAICDYIVKDSHHASFRDFNYIVNHTKVLSEAPTRTSGNPITINDLIDGVIKHSENTNWDSKLLENFKKTMGR